MVAKRIIPCLDVKDGKVVKGIRFQNHRIMGDMIELAKSYCAAGADELVFYDITASSDQRSVDMTWIANIAQEINIPFCVAGGIRSVSKAAAILHAGADKISINSPAIETPHLINALVYEFGQQCVVVGIDSLKVADQFHVCQYTGDIKQMQITSHTIANWLTEVQDRGAGEIVLNCMNQDGIKNGYDIEQLATVRELAHIPLVASGGAGIIQHFIDVFKKTNVDGALAASVFHSNQIAISDLKLALHQNNIRVRLC